MPGTRKQLCEYRHQKNHEDCWGKVGAGFLRKSLFTCFLKEVFYCQIFLLGSDFQRHFDWKLFSAHLCFEISSFIPSVLQQSDFQNLKSLFMYLVFILYTTSRSLMVLQTNWCDSCFS